MISVRQLLVLGGTDMGHKYLAVITQDGLRRTEKYAKSNIWKMCRVVRPRSKRWHYIFGTNHSEKGCTLVKMWERKIIM